MTTETLAEDRRFCPDYDSWTGAVLEVADHIPGHMHFKIERWKCYACDGTHQRNLSQCPTCGTVIAG